MKTPGRSFRAELKNEIEKMKNMTFRGKVSYFFAYYKHLIVIFLILCLFGYFVGDWIVQSRKDIVLEGFFTNDEWDLFNASALTDEYREHFSLEGRQDVYFDDSLYVDLTGEITDYSTASASKIVVYLANNELDFIVTVEPVFDYYSESVSMCDFRDLLPEDLLAELEDYLIFVDAEDGANGAWGLDLTACRYVTGVGADKEPLVDDTYVMFVPDSAPHKETVAEYIRFLFEQP